MVVVWLSRLVCQQKHCCQSPTQYLDACRRASRYIAGKVSPAKLSYFSTMQCIIPRRHTMQRRTLLVDAVMGRPRVATTLLFACPFYFWYNPVHSACARIRSLDLPVPASPLLNTYPLQMYLLSTRWLPLAHVFISSKRMTALLVTCLEGFRLAMQNIENILPELFKLSPLCLQR